MTKQDPVIVTAHFTTNNHDRSGQSIDILVDPEHAKHFNDHTLCVQGPKKGIFIVRDSKGNYLRRKGKDGTGVSLASYLHGRNFMRRVDKEDTDDYTAAAFKVGSGKPSPIELLSTPESGSVKGTLFMNEYNQYMNSDEVTDERCKVTQRTIKKMVRQRQIAKDAEPGSEINCPSCGNAFVKTHGKMAFCSSYSRRGPNGEQCKDTFNTSLRQLEKGSTRVKPIKKTTIKSKPTTKTPKVETITKPINQQPTSSGDVITLTEPNGRTITMPLSGFQSTDLDRLRILFDRN